MWVIMILVIIPFALKFSFKYKYGTSDMHFKRYGSLLNAMHTTEHSSSETEHNQMKLDIKLADYLLKSETKTRICQLMYT